MITENLIYRNISIDFVTELRIIGKLFKAVTQSLWRYTGKLDSLLSCFQAGNKQKMKLPVYFNRICVKGLY
jgi:hypothetical protein